jgi:DNA-binding transcriptional LysR family regulator
MDLLSQMETFVRVVESGSLSAAARGLRLSLPAVSRQLTALEEQLGAPLVLRTTRRLSVTPAGRQYYERCLRILREVEDAQASVREQRAVSGLLTVTAPVTVGLLLLGPHLPSLLAAHPGLRMDLRLEDRLIDLVEDGVDVALRAGVPPPDSTSFIAWPLKTFRRLVVASPRYLKKRGEPKAPEALAQHEVLIHQPGTGTGATWRLQRAGGEVSVSVAGALRISAPLGLRDAAVAGLGITSLPDWLVAEDLAAGRLKALLPGWETPPQSVFALHRAELRGAPRVRAFVEHLREAWARDAAGARG